MYTAYSPPKKHLNGNKYYVHSFKVIQAEDSKIILVEEFPCKSKMELEAREAHYIRSNECVNKSILGRTIKQWYEDNVDKHKEKIECECGKMVRRTGMKQHQKGKQHAAIIRIKIHTIRNNQIKLLMDRMPPRAVNSDVTPTPAVLFIVSKDFINTIRKGKSTFRILFNILENIPPAIFLRLEINLRAS